MEDHYGYPVQRPHIEVKVYERFVNTCDNYWNRILLDKITQLKEEWKQYPETR